MGDYAGGMPQYNNMMDLDPASILAGAGGIIPNAEDTYFEKCVRKIGYLGTHP